MDVLDNPKYSYLVEEQSFFYKIFKNFFYYYAKTVFNFYAPLQVYGRKNIPDCSFIISSNHNSHMDVALLSVATKKDYNQIAMLAAKDYFFDSWIRRNLINMGMNLIPIDRKKDGVRKFSIDKTLALCEKFMEFKKRNLIMFPEGTRGEPGVLQPFQKGAAMFSINLNKPILPAVIYGSHKVWPKGNFFFSLPKKIFVHILKPIYPNKFITSDNPTKDEIDKATKEITLFLENTIKEKCKLLYE
tara:strand:+ start:123 stop:854 length:732 start_codon:yes stop_codon:yes gene_type:complete